MEYHKKKSYTKKYILWKLKNTIIPFCKLFLSLLVVILNCIIVNKYFYIRLPDEKLDWVINGNLIPVSLNSYYILPSNINIDKYELLIYNNSKLTKKIFNNIEKITNVSIDLSLLDCGKCEEEKNLGIDKPLWDIDYCPQSGFHIYLIKIIFILCFFMEWFSIYYKKKKDSEKSPIPQFVYTIIFNILWNDIGSIYMTTVKNSINTFKILDIDTSYDLPMVFLGFIFVFAIILALPVCVIFKLIFTLLNIRKFVYLSFSINFVKNLFNFQHSFNSVQFYLPQFWIIIQFIVSLFFSIIDIYIMKFIEKEKEKEIYEMEQIERNIEIV